jgi:hypothetical protein
MTAAIDPRRLWFGLVAAPAAWTVQGLVGWFVGARICTQMSIGSVRAVGGVVGLAALLCALAAIVVGRDNWRRASAQGPPAADRVAFLSLGGLFVSVSFAIGIVWALASPLVLDACGAAR